MLLVVVALCLKAALPTGFMISQQSRTLTVEICADSLGRMVTHQLVLPMKGDAGGEQGKGECPFASLSMASLDAADPVLLAAALAFILALGFAPAHLPRLERATRLRPPLRGPPATA